MKRPSWSLLVLLIAMTGCATHYYRTTDDEVSFYLVKAEAQTVYLACSLDNFEPRRARRIDGGRWEVQLPPNREFRYFYLVDGAVYLPPCRLTETDDYGSKNCIFVPGL